MQVNKEYIISFSGLSLGEHDFDFKVSKALFGYFENEDIVDADVSLNIMLNKEERMLSFNFVFEGTLTVLCDRCLEPLKVCIEGENNLYVKFGEEYLEEDDDVIVIPAVEHKIDLSNFIYEYILLQKPMQCVHKEERDCNQEMLKLYNDSTLVNENDEESVDPRWEALKNIKFDKQN